MRQNSPPNMFGLCRDCRFRARHSLEALEICLAFAEKGEVVGPDGHIIARVSQRNSPWEKPERPSFAVHPDFGCCFFAPRPEK